MNLRQTNLRPERRMAVRQRMVLQLLNPSSCQSMFQSRSQGLTTHRDRHREPRFSEPQATKGGLQKLLNRRARRIPATPVQQDTEEDRLKQIPISNNQMGRARHVRAFFFEIDAQLSEFSLWLGRESAGDSPQISSVFFTTF